MNEQDYEQARARLQDIGQFVANHTGLELERATRILNLGEPWPLTKALGDFFTKSYRDAKACGMPWETAMNTYAALIDAMGVDEEVRAKATEQHIARTAALSGEEDETVDAVGAALQELYRRLHKAMEQAVELAAKKREP